MCIAGAQSTDSNEARSSNEGSDGMNPHHDPRDTDGMIEIVLGFGLCVWIYRYFVGDVLMVDVLTMVLNRSRISFFYSILYGSNGVRPPIANEGQVGLQVGLLVRRTYGTCYQYLSFQI